MAGKLSGIDALSARAAQVRREHDARAEGRRPVAVTIAQDRGLEAKPKAESGRNSAQAKRKARKPVRRGVLVSYTMPKGDRDFISETAAAHGLSASAYVRLACREYARQQGW